MMKPVSSVWRVVEHGSPKTFWVAAGTGDEAGWKALAEKSPDRFSIEYCDLVPQSALSDAEARIAKLLQDYDAAYNRGLKDGNRQSVEQQQAIHAAEARAEAAEARLKEQEADDASLLGKLKVMRGIYAMQKEEYTSRALHNIITEFEAFRAARAIHHKIGVKDE